MYLFVLKIGYFEFIRSCSFVAFVFQFWSIRLLTYFRKKLLWEHFVQASIRNKRVQTFQENYHFLPHKSHSMMKKYIFIFITKSPLPPPPLQCWNKLRGHCHMIATLIRGEGVKYNKRKLENSHIERKCLISRGFSSTLSLIVALKKFSNNY